MKTKFLFAAFLLVSFFTSYAQKSIPKGSLLLGGDISFNNHTYEDGTSPDRHMKSFSISPSLGLAVKENLFIGFNAGFNFSKGGGYSDSSIRHGYSAGLFLRKYKSLKNNFYIFLQAGLGGYYAKEKLEDAAPTRQYYQKTFGANATLTPGISYAISSKLQLETGFNSILGVGYSGYENTDNANYTGVRKETFLNVFSSLNNFSSSLYIGFRLLLQKKNKQVASSKSA